MLTARHGKDYLCIPFHCLLQCIIRCRVTGMQGHHHIHFIAAFIFCNIPMEKLQLPIAIAPGKFIAMTDHILFEVQTGDRYILSLKLMQIIIQGKGQIGLSAAKVNDMHGSLLLQCRQNILYKFKVAVNLFKFIIPGMYNFPLGSLNSQINEKRNRNSFLQNIVLLTVVLHDRFQCFFSGFRWLELEGCPSLFTYKHMESALHVLSF